VLQTNLVNVWWLAFLLRDLQWTQVDPRGTLAAIRTTKHVGAELSQFMIGVTQPNWNALLHSLVKTGPAHVMDVQQDPCFQLDWLERVQPHCLLSYPSNLVALARLVRSSGRKIPRLSAIQSISETLPPETKREVENAFGVPVWNAYSCREAGYLASPCPERHGLHVHSENVLLEVLDPSNRPCRVGETGRVVLTTLHNFLAPFVRYEIQDEATVGPERCPCGRGLPLLTHVGGKARPLFLLPDGRWKNSAGIVLEVRQIEGIHQQQIIQRATDHVILRIVPNATWNETHAVRARRAVHEFFQQPIRVDIETLDRLPVTGAGKLRDVICEIPT
jgi:phenylacetate-CoA ligase